VRDKINDGGTEDLNWAVLGVFTQKLPASDHPTKEGSPMDSEMMDSMDKISGWSILRNEAYGILLTGTSYELSRFCMIFLSVAAARTQPRSLTLKKIDRPHQTSVDTQQTF